LRKSILLIEDNYELSRIFQTFLNSKGLKVEAFSNASQALVNFRANIDLYSIILTDFKLKGMNGMELAKEIRRLKGNSVLIIMITGYSVYEVATEAEVATIIDRVIMKPFSLRSLYVIFSDYLECAP
jgi:two-component system sensor histidine kinase/response regulator